MRDSWWLERVELIRVFRLAKTILLVLGFYLLSRASKVGYPLVCQCAQENRWSRSHFEIFSNLFPVRERCFPDLVVFLAGFGIFLTSFLGRITRQTRDSIILY